MIGSSINQSFALTSKGPTIMGFVGPNGSGKSSIVEKLGIEGVLPGDDRFQGRMVVDPDTGHVIIPIINPDEISKQLGLAFPSLSMHERAAHAFDEANRIRAIYSEARIDFALETVGSHESRAEFFEELGSKGYYVCILFVGTDNPEINILRVKQRVAHGGHDVPMDKVVARYERTMRLLPRYYLAADHMVVYDNSIDVLENSGCGPRLLLVKRGDQVELTTDGAESVWLRKRLQGFI